MPLTHKTSQKVKEQLHFQDFTGFRSFSTLVWKILTSVGEKMTKNEKSRFSGILRNLLITFLKNDLESINLAK